MNTRCKALAFGVFDTFHDGHRHFLRKAKMLGDTLAVAVAQDDVVFKLKGKFPKTPLAERMKILKASGLADEVLAGDELINSWGVINRTRPDVIALGYDQKELASALNRFAEQNGLSFEISTITPFENGDLHSSNLKQNL